MIRIKIIAVKASRPTSPTSWKQFPGTGHSAGCIFAGDGLGG
jgi:hypothetical protein